MVSEYLIGFLLIIIIFITYFLPSNVTIIAIAGIVIFMLICYFVAPTFLSQTANGGFLVYIASVLSLAIPFYQIQNRPWEDHSITQNELTNTLMGSVAIVLVIYIIELRGFGNLENQNNGESIGINKMFFIGALYNWLNYIRMYILNSFFTMNGIKPEDGGSKLTNYIKNEVPTEYVDKNTK